MLENRASFRLERWLRAFADGDVFTGQLTVGSDQMDVAAQTADGTCCADGLDNDGFIDCEDADCLGLGDCRENDPTRRAASRLCHIGHGIQSR